MTEPSTSTKPPAPTVWHTLSYQDAPPAIEFLQKAFGFVDAVFAQALAAGATAVREPTDQDYGGRNCVLRDPEGNQWSFGSYHGA
ncbi:MAG: VOC family protein [Nocardioidaceae bacterium]